MERPLRGFARGVGLARGHLPSPHRAARTTSSRQKPRRRRLTPGALALRRQQQAPLPRRRRRRRRRRARGTASSRGWHRRRVSRRRRGSRRRLRTKSRVLGRRRPGPDAGSGWRTRSPAAAARPRRASRARGGRARPPQSGCSPPWCHALVVLMVLMVLVRVPRAGVVEEEAGQVVDHGEVGQLARRRDVHDAHQFAARGRGEVLHGDAVRGVQVRDALREERRATPRPRPGGKRTARARPGRASRTPARAETGAWSSPRPFGPRRWHPRSMDAAGGSTSCISKKSTGAHVRRPNARSIAPDTDPTRAAGGRSPPVLPSRSGAFSNLVCFSFLLRLRENDSRIQIAPARRHERATAALIAAGHERRKARTLRWWCRNTLHVAPRRRAPAFGPRTAVNHHGAEELAVPGTSARFFHSTKRDPWCSWRKPPELVCPACDDVFEGPARGAVRALGRHACISTTAGRTGRCFSCAQPADPDDFEADGSSPSAWGRALFLPEHHRRQDSRGRHQPPDALARVGLRRELRRRPRNPGSEVYARKDDFPRNRVFARLGASRDLDDHEATCGFQTLVCGLCDEEEDEEVDVRLSANLSPGKESLRGGDPGDGELAADSGGAPPRRRRRGGGPAARRSAPAPCGFACLRRDAALAWRSAGTGRWTVRTARRGRRAAGAARRGARGPRTPRHASPRRGRAERVWAPRFAADLEKHKATACSCS